MLSRRKIFGWLSGLTGTLAVAPFATAASLPTPVRTVPIRVLGLAQLKVGKGEANALTVDDLHAWANTVTTRSICVTTIPAFEYVLGVRVPDNERDIAQGTDVLIRTFIGAIDCFCQGAAGKPIYWRIKPHMDTWKGEFVEYREDGPDICNLTDRRCVKDYSHRYIKVRARIAVDNVEFGTMGTFSERDGVPDGWRLIERKPDDLAIVCVKGA